MRIISGKFKGITLNSPKSDNIRPTGDKVKQAIFTKLQFDVIDAKVLDLFAGSGALGIEAISKGAKKVVFVDNDVRSVELLKSNLKKIHQGADILTCDFQEGIKRLKETFDIILIDPPYKSNFYNKVLDMIYEYKLLNEDGIIVCEHAREDEISSKEFDIYDIKYYGTVAVTYLRNKK